MFSAAGSSCPCAAGRVKRCRLLLANYVRGSWPLLFVRSCSPRPAIAASNAVYSCLRTASEDRRCFFVRALACSAAGYYCPCAAGRVERCRLLLVFWPNAGRRRHTDGVYVGLPRSGWQPVRPPVMGDTSSICSWIPPVNAGAAPPGAVLDNSHHVQDPVFVIGQGWAAHELGVNDMAVLPAGHIVTASDDGSVVISEENGRVARLESCRHRSHVLCVAALGGNVVLSADEDGLFTIWDAVTKDELCYRKMNGIVSAAVRLDRLRFAIAVGHSPARVEIWQCGRHVHGGNRQIDIWRTIDDACQDTITALDVDLLGRLHITSMDMKSYVYDVRDDHAPPSFVGSQAAHGSGVNCVHAGSRWVAYGDKSGDVVVSSLNPLHVESIIRSRGPDGLHTNSVAAVLVVGDTLVSAGHDRYLVFSSLPEGKVDARHQLTAAPTSLAVVPPDRLAIAYANGHVSVIPLPASVLPLQGRGFEGSPSANAGGSETPWRYQRSQKASGAATNRNNPSGRHARPPVFKRRMDRPKNPGKSRLSKDTRRIQEKFSAFEATAIARMAAPAAKSPPPPRASDSRGDCGPAVAPSVATASSKQPPSPSPPRESASRGNSGPAAPPTRSIPTASPKQLPTLPTPPSARRGDCGPAVAPSVATAASKQPPPPSPPRESASRGNSGPAAPPTRSVSTAAGTRDAIAERSLSDASAPNDAPVRGRRSRGGKRHLRTKKKLIAKYGADFLASA